MLSCAWIALSIKVTCFILVFGVTVVRLLVEIADGARGDLCAPNSVISSTRRTDTPTRYISIRGFLDRAFTAFVAFDDGRLELDALEFGHAQLDFTGSRAEIPLVMTGTVALTVSRPLILASTDKLVRLMVEQGIPRFFYAVAYKILSQTSQLLNR